MYVCMYGWVCMYVWVGVHVLMCIGVVHQIVTQSLFFTVDSTDNRPMLCLRGQLQNCHSYT